jgi:cell division protein FtsN
MPRDYAKSSNREKKRGSLPGWVWMLGGLAIGLFVAFIIWLNNKVPSQDQDSIATVIQETFSELKENARKRETPKSETPVQKQEAKKEADKPKTSFDFYYILPELEVAVPERELVSRTQEAKTSTQQEHIEYIIQAGAFRQHEQADKLKAKLALHGIIAYIETVNNNSDTWHRVRIGPISDLAQLNQTRKRLKNNGIANIVVKPKT